MAVVRRLLGWVGLGGVALGLWACSSTSLHRAPVEDRSGPVAAPAAVPPPVVRQPQGFENAGKPGYYTVKPGDTLIRIALDHGQSVQDIARWSQVDNPNRIEVGQVLRVEPPPGEVVVQPVSKPAVAVAAAAGATAAASKPAAAPAAAASAPAPATSKAAASGEISWMWPSNGKIIAGFDEVKNKGIDIAGSAGDPVVAAADGRVIFAGSNLRGYGNLIILKHDNVFLTAYAHNQTLLVKEDQSVVKGQKIAEMGSSDADRVKLHFELRKQGKPVDPVQYLPAR